MNTAKTVIVTGASQGIGAGTAELFLAHGYNVVATSRDISAKQGIVSTERWAAVDGDITDPETARRVIGTAVDRFGAVDVVVNNAGLFFSKPFLEYTLEDYRKFSAVNSEGFLHMTQMAAGWMLAQGRPGCIITITTARVANPILGSPDAVPMLTKAGLEAATRSLAIEFASRGIRFNAVAPGKVDTPMHSGASKEALQKLSPMGVISSVSDLASAVLYLAEAPTVTGEVLHVDGGAHVGKW